MSGIIQNPSQGFFRTVKALPVCFLILLLSSGCMMDMAMDYNGDIRCFVSEDCPVGQRCILGLCTSVPDFEVSLEVFPQPTSDYLPFVLQDLDLNSPDALDFSIPLPAYVTGDLILNNMPFTGSARVSFSSESGPRRTLRYSSDLDSEDERSSSFDIQLPGKMLRSGRMEHIPYMITVEPRGNYDCCSEKTQECPVPIVISGTRFRAQSNNIVLAFAEQPTRISGTIMKSQDQPLPQANLRVQAWSETGSIYSLPVVSGDNGEFCLALDLSEAKSGESDIRIRISPASAENSSEHAIAPTIEHSISVISGEHIENLELFIGNYGKPETVNGVLSDINNQPVEGAQVVFNGNVSSGGTYSTSTFTGSDGSFSVNVLEGSYHIRMVPPASSRSSTVSIPVYHVKSDLFDDDHVYEINVKAQKRTLIKGHLAERGNYKNQLENVEILANDISAPLNGIARIDYFSTVTDEEGNFELFLDPGIYNLQFRPPWSSGLPWMVGLQITVEENSPENLGRIIMEKATFLDGKALGDTGTGLTEPLPGAIIEVYARKDSHSFLLWKGRAENNGSFRVALPESLTGIIEDIEEINNQDSINNDF